MAKTYEDSGPPPPSWYSTTAEAVPAPYLLPEQPEDRVSLLTSLCAQANGPGGYNESIRDVLAFALGDQVRSTPRTGAETEPHWYSKPRFAPNLLGYCLDKLASLYDVDPIRTTGDPAQDERWREVLWDAGDGLSSLMAYADPRLMLCGTLAAYVRPVDGELDVWLATPDEWQALPISEDVRKLGAVELQLARWRDANMRGADPSSTTLIASSYDLGSQAWVPPAYPGDAVGLEHVQHVYWDAEYTAVVRDFASSSAAVGANAFGSIPVALLRNTLAPGLYGCSTGGRDLIGNVRALNNYWQELLHASRIGGRGQPWVSGGHKPLTIAPDSVWELEQDSVSGIHQGGVQIGPMLDALNAAIEALSLSMGAPRRTLRLRDPLATASTTILAELLELSQVRRRRMRILERCERQIHRVAATVWEAETGEALNPRVSVRYVDAPLPMTSEEALKRARELLDLGLADRPEVARSVYPDRTPQERAEILESADKERRDRAREQAIVAGHAEDVTEPESEPETQAGMQSDMPMMDEEDEDEETTDE